MLVVGALGGALLLYKQRSAEQRRQSDAERERRYGVNIQSAAGHFRGGYTCGIEQPGGSRVGGSGTMALTITPTSATQATARAEFSYRESGSSKQVYTGTYLLQGNIAGTDLVLVPTQWDTPSSGGHGMLTITVKSVVGQDPQNGLGTSMTGPGAQCSAPLQRS